MEVKRKKVIRKTGNKRTKIEQIKVKRKKGFWKTGKKETKRKRKKPL